MTILATTAAPSHRDRSRSARARGFLVTEGLTVLGKDQPFPTDA
jgi:hypothetical protein